MPLPGSCFPAVRSIGDLRAPEFKAFFEDDWVSRFRQYDASYLHPQGEIQTEVREAIWRLIEAAPENADDGNRHETRPQSDPVTPVRGGWTTRVAALFSLVVSGALLVTLYRSLDVGLVAQALLQADAVWLAISVGMIVPITYLRAVRFYWVAPPGALPGMAEAFRLTLVASALNVFLPAKTGDLVKSYFVATRSNTAAGVALSIAVYERLCDLFGLIVCCLVFWVIGKPQVAVIPVRSGC